MKIARLANAQAARAQRPIPSPKSILRPSVTVKTYPIGENPRAVLGQLSPKLSPVHDWDKLRAAYMRATTDPARQAAMGYGRGPQGGTTDGIRPNYPAAGGIVPQPPSQTIGGLQIAAQRPFPGQNSGAPPPMAIQTSAGQIQGDAALNGPPSLGRPLPSQPMSPSEVIARNMAMSTVRPDAIPLAGPSSLGPTHPRGVMPFPGRRAEHIGDDVPSISGTRPLRSPYSIASSHGLNDAPPQVGMAPDQDRPGASTSGSGGDMSPGPSSVTFHSADEVSKRLARKTVEVISSRPRSRGLASESRISKHPRVSKGRTAPSVDDERFSILSGEVEEEGMDTIGQGEDAVVPREACRTILPSTSWYSKLFHWL
ncbi:hypothetical protein JAAARDRAFT_29869 [Jaapia argillacea MUCL 33604]|uniref:Uncharacterized protein n=1 Tax=Jaapia argillacea MUCL 33604 TaxID=933084 RepID=A0A067QMF9_9AGAM|nr:hypothetical protein JAAARDRAFT_29869 [Jaapia argillacea MUCL 33604]